MGKSYVPYIYREKSLKQHNVHGITDNHFICFDMELLYLILVIPEGCTHSICIFFYDVNWYTINCDACSHSDRSSHWELLWYSYTYLLGLHSWSHFAQRLSSHTCTIHCVPKKYPYQCPKL